MYRKNSLPVVKPFGDTLIARPCTRRKREGILRVSHLWFTRRKGYDARCGLPKRTCYVPLATRFNAVDCVLTVHNRISSMLFDLFAFYSSSARARDDVIGACPCGKVTRGGRNLFENCTVKPFYRTIRVNEFSGIRFSSCFFFFFFFFGLLSIISFLQ